MQSIRFKLILNITILPSQLAVPKDKTTKSKIIGIAIKTCGIKKVSLGTCYMQDEGSSTSGGKRKASSVPATPSTPMTGDFGKKKMML